MTVIAPVDAHALSSIDYCTPAGTTLMLLKGEPAISLVLTTV